MKKHYNLFSHGDAFVKNLARAKFSTIFVLKSNEIWKRYITRYFREFLEYFDLPDFEKTLFLKTSSLKTRTANNKCNSVESLFCGVKKVFFAQFFCTVLVSRENDYRRLLFENWRFVSKTFNVSMVYEQWFLRYFAWKKKAKCYNFCIFLFDFDSKIACIILIILPRNALL